MERAKTHVVSAALPEPDVRFVDFAPRALTASSVVRQPDCNLLSDVFEPRQGRHNSSPSASWGC